MKNEQQDYWERIDSEMASRTLREIGLEYLEGNTEVESLFFGDLTPPLTDNELDHLKGLTGLRKLDLKGAAISDDGMASLQGMVNLEQLWLGGSRSQITDKGLVHLEGLASLKHLEIWSTHVTDSGIEHLKCLASLESLHLSGMKLTVDGIKELQQALPKCRIVHYR